MEVVEVYNTTDFRYSGFLHCLSSYEIDYKTIQTQKCSCCYVHFGGVITCCKEFCVPGTLIGGLTLLFVVDVPLTVHVYW